MPLSVASIGCDWLEDERVDDIEFGSSYTLLGRDVVLLSLSGSLLTRGTFTHWRGAPNLSLSDSVRLQENIERRRLEIAKLLERGATIVVFVPAPSEWYIDTGKREYSGTGRSRVTKNIVDKRQLEDVFPFPLKTTKGGADDFEVVGGDPFATFWRKIGAGMSCTAFMTQPLGGVTLRIRNTDCAVASIARIKSGAVIALPDRMHNDVKDTVFVDALLELVRAVRADGGDFSLPAWASGYVIGPEDELRAAADEAQRRVDEALQRADAAKSALEMLQRRKLLITGQGKALEAVVHEALTALGFVVQEGAPGRTDRIAVHPTFGPAVVEVKGKGKSAAEKDSAQLEKWVAAYIEEHDVKPKPLLVVNAWRELPLDDRTELAFPDQMLAYAKARDHCLVTGAQLLCAWIEVEAYPERADAIVAALVETAGRFGRYETAEPWIQGLPVSEVKAAS